MSRISWEIAKTANCTEYCGGFDLMSQIQDWAEQYRTELEKQSSARAAQVESLLIAGDFDAIGEWLAQWESEDKAPDSLSSRYRQARCELRKERYRERQRQLYGSVVEKITGGKASAKTLDGSGADLLSQRPQ
jgi:hypothetical protein